MRLNLFGVGLWAFLAGSCVLAGEEASWTVPVPEGETPLADVGLARLFWQSYGKEPGSLRMFAEDASGAVYRNYGVAGQHQAVMMHPPWRVPAGKIWVDYPLALPQMKPVRLTFGIAMAPDAVGPGKGDGATFSCYVIDNGKERELLRRHYAKVDWIDCNFDLSEYAGKTVVVRLQVEPGPKKRHVVRLRLDSRRENRGGCEKSRSGASDAGDARFACVSGDVERRTRLDAQHFQARRDALERAAL